MPCVQLLQVFPLGHGAQILSSLCMHWQRDASEVLPPLETGHILL